MIQIASGKCAPGNCAFTVKTMVSRIEWNRASLGFGAFETTLNNEENFGFLKIFPPQEKKKNVSGDQNFFRR